MSCDECRVLIDEYIEGELGDAVAARTSAHLAACLTCGFHYEVVLHEQRAYAQYLLDVEASPALWAAVQTGIETVKAAHVSRPWRRLSLTAPFRFLRLSPALAFALALITIGVTIGVLRYVNSREANQGKHVSQKGKDMAVLGARAKADHIADGAQRKPKRNDGSAPNGVATSESRGAKPDNLISRAAATSVNRVALRRETSRAESAIDGVVGRTERQYLAAIKLLSGDFAHRRSQLDTNAAEQVERVLADLDRMIEETRSAVRQHPDDPIAVQYMMTAYARKVDALRQLVRS